MIDMVFHFQERVYERCMRITQILYSWRVVSSFLLQNGDDVLSVFTPIDDN